MTLYEVHLKSTDTPVPVVAEKFNCESDSHVVFYARSDPKEKFEEVARFETKNVSAVEEVDPLVYPKV